MALGFRLNRISLSVLAAFVAVICVTSSVPALAQSATGTVIGQVTDQSGAAIGGADVKLTETSTSSVYNAKTNDVGRYTFNSVAPGTYEFTVSAAGFNLYKIAAQKVDVGSTLTLNASMQVGAASTVVEVQAQAGAELQTLNATIGTTIHNDQLQLLPNLGRDASTLSVLQVGVSLAGNVAGAATDQNGFQLDGGSNSDDMAGSNAVYTPANGYSGAGSTGGTPTGVIPTPIESIEEFKVGTSGQTADFNSAAGSQVQMVTKRGTNAFHGALYEFYFGSSVGAANLWKNNHTLTASGEATPLPDTHRNRFGGAIGGPLTPKFWGGKTYFFVNYEGMRYPNIVSYESGSPTALMRAGVLTLPNAAGQNTPYNLNPFPVTVGGTTYQPAQCGGGPCDPRGLGVNPLVQKLWNTMPMPNDAGFTNGNSTAGLVDGVNAQGYIANLALPQSSDFLVGRIDHDFGDKWKFMSSYRFYDFSQVVSTQVDVGGLLGGAAGQYVSYAPRPQKPWFFVAGLTGTITPNLTNDFRFSYLRNFWQWNTQAGPAQFAGLGGAIEVGGESEVGSLMPYNVDSQDTRQRFWDGHDYFLSDNLSYLHGNHLFQFGGSYLRNFDYHARNDNGVGIDTSIVYQLSGVGVNSAAYTLPNGAQPTYNLANYAFMYNELMGIVSQSQVMYTRSGNSLTLNPLGTSGFDKSVVPTYDTYFTDTWHLRPTLTLTYGLGWGIAMPPYEIAGKQVQMVDAAGSPLNIQAYLLNKQSAALAGQVYNPTIGFETIRNVNGGENKYPYNPYWGGFSPRASLAWSPSFGDGILGKVFGHNQTVLRGGYARIYGRLNGVDLLLVPLLGPGLLQAVACVSPLTNGTCAGPGGATPSNGFRIGADGLSAPLPTATQTLPQPFIPGAIQNGILNAAAADGSQLDPALKPNHSDEFNFSIQRQIGSKFILEAGYIGRKISNEFQNINIDTVPWMTTLGGQSFAQAWAATYNQICAGQGPSCTPVASAATPQPFFEAVMGGPNSAYCAGSPSCTAAVVKNEGKNIASVSASTTWLDLSKASSWTLGRSVMAQSLGTGLNAQLSGAFEYINSLGHGNYNAGFFKFNTTDWHGLTTQSNLTYGRALGTGSVVQASSSITVPNPYDFNGFGTYGVQPFDIKMTYSLLMLYQPPVFKSQHGFMGHVLGGWSIAPLFTARSGNPLRVSVGGNTQAFGELIVGQSSSNYEEAAGNGPFTGGNSANYNVAIPTGSANPKGVASAGKQGINIFSDPVAVYNEFRNPVLGQDFNSGGAGAIRGFPYWNLDATVSKNFSIAERINATLSFQFVNVLNHFTPQDPTTNIATPSSFGVVTQQYTSPNGSINRTMEFGLRIGF
ncbi:MAG TPA: carboxypeptidase regulatory-like domain-containing protein [Bryobacteraceae bacterium]|nr:carboxypeptidase regulatory-like domain-containing protein [Bryobacteraceae bacterium]